MVIRSKTAKWLRCAADCAAAVLLAAGLATGLAGSAEADDSAPAASPRVAAVMSMPGSADRDTVSVVVIAGQKRLFAFVDRYDDNEPLEGADLRIETPRRTLALTEVSPGIYRSEPYTPPASITPLTVRMDVAGATASASADLLSPALAEAVPASGSSHRSVLWAGAAMALALAVLWLWQHPVAIRRRPPGPGPLNA